MLFQPSVQAVAENTIILSDDLQHQVEELAREQNRKPGEVLEEAVRRYAGARRLERFAHKAGKHARTMGLKEDDIPRSLMRSAAKMKRVGVSAAGHSRYECPDLRAGIPSRKAVPASPDGAARPNRADRIASDY
jgi:predicted transcriptional regulator